MTPDELLVEQTVLRREDVYHSKFFDKQIAYRYLFGLTDGHTIESAAYQHFRGNEQEPQDLSIDISTMVGCPIGCKFCEAASISYARPLTVAEMVAQVLLLVKKHDFPRFPQIMCSFQGIGEPSLIPQEIIEASSRLIKTDERFDISIATTGANLVAFRIWRDSGIPIRNLQVSCSGTELSQTRRLIPKSPGIEKLLAEIRLCVESPNFYQVKLNYILIQGYNDSDDDLLRLISLFKQTSAIIKLSALNPTRAAQRHKLTPSSLARAQEFCQALQLNGVNSFVHGSFDSTNVSCGQLTEVNP